MTPRADAAGSPGHGGDELQGQGQHEHEGHVPRAAERSRDAFTPHEARQARRLGTVLAIVAVFFVLELGGAVLAGSVVLQAEALHLLMDVFALGVSLLAMRLAVRRPTARFTFGLRRAEPVAAVFSALLVLLTTAFVVVEALEALRGQAQPLAGVMLVVAAAGLVVNGFSAWLLHDAMAHPPTHVHDPDNPEDAALCEAALGHAYGAAKAHGHDHGHSNDHAHPDAHAHAKAPARANAPSHGHALNLRGVWLHLVGDTLGALAALVAALIIRFGGGAAADPIASFVVAAILVVGSMRLLRDATLVLLESAPPHLAVDGVRSAIARYPGVLAVHDLHVWTLGAGHDAITVHVATSSRDPAFGHALSEHLRATLGAEYVTVQVDPEGPDLPWISRTP